MRVGSSEKIGSQSEPTIEQLLGVSPGSDRDVIERIFFEEPPRPDRNPLHREVLQILLDAHPTRNHAELWELRQRLESGEFDDENDQYLGGLYDGLRYTMNENVKLPLLEGNDDE